MTTLPVLYDLNIAPFDTQEVLSLGPGALESLDLPPIALAREVERLVALNSPVAYGSSGGKDGSAAAFAFNDHLDAVGHTGPRLVVHSDLGSIEWKDSLPSCERLARALDLDLVVVKPLRDMVSRWWWRWACNLERYINLRCVKLIGPWSSKKMRFCTADKFSAITQEMARRFRGQTIISVSGIRRQEGPDRAKAPVFEYEDKFSRAAARDSSYGITQGVSYRPIIDWRVQHVLAILHRKRFDLHNGYTRYGMNRVSCFFCVLSSMDGLLKSIANPAHHDVYRELCLLEAQSGYSFQPSRWLADISPDTLDASTRLLIAEAKEKAAIRNQVESTIPKHLLYTTGWPTIIPTTSEADLLSRVRNTVAGLLGITIRYADPASIIARYEELMQLNLNRKSKKRKSKKPGPGHCGHIDPVEELEVIPPLPGRIVQPTLW